MLSENVCLRGCFLQQKVASHFSFDRRPFFFTCFDSTLCSEKRPVFIALPALSQRTDLLRRNSELLWLAFSPETSSLHCLPQPSRHRMSDVLLAVRPVTYRQGTSQLLGFGPIIDLSTTLQTFCLEGVFTSASHGVPQLAGMLVISPRFRRPSRRKPRRIGTLLIAFTKLSLVKDDTHPESQWTAVTLSFAEADLYAVKVQGERCSIGT